jgi:hypothetical protein
MKTSKNNIHTGEMLENYMSKHRYTKAELGRGINRLGISVFQYIQNSSIQTGILIDICHALEHNFFQDMADQLPHTFSKNNANSTSYADEKDQLIALLQQENKVLKIQNDLLMKIKG